MPFPRIRKLPCELANLIDKKSVDPSLTFYNPSISASHICMRVLEKSKNQTEVNCIAMYSRDKKTLKRIATPKDALKPSCAFYTGIEDARIVAYEGRVWFIATSTHASSSMMSEMIIGRFNDDVSAIDFVQHLEFGVKPLKNTCPFVWNGKLCLVDIYTLTIYEIVIEKGDDGKESCRLEVIKSLRPCHGMSRCMVYGSTSPVHLHGNTWGCVVHEHIKQARDRTMSLAYISYWMEFDIERGMVSFFSTPFIIAQWGVEFVSGIEYSAKDGVVELYMGIADKVAVVARAKLYDLRVGY